MDGLLGHLGTLVMLIFLQAVLGFDNLLYISIESKRVVEEKQQYVRRVGIGLAIVLRIVLLFVIVEAISALQGPLFEIKWTGVVESIQTCTPGVDGAAEVCIGGITGHMVIVFFGGVFILYTAVKEILHMMSIEEEENQVEEKKRSPGAAIFWIVIMNLVFSFDSILGAIALTDNFAIMATAVVLSGIMMMVMADHVTNFLKKNRMYEVLGLFILFLVGVMLTSEAGHLGQLKFFGHEIHALSKSTFYFVLVILVIVDVVQSRYQKKINLEKKRMAEQAKAESPS